MKKVLGLAVLMMVMLVSVSGLAISDTEVVPVYLNVPAFVRLSVDTSSPDSQFDLVFNPLDPDITVSDTVALLAEANVSYNVSSSVAAVSGHDDWADLLSITIDSGATGFGTPGSTTFNTTASINVIDYLNLGTLPTNTKIADVTFTISSL